jgi:hypothetical protein
LSSSLLGAAFGPTIAAQQANAQNMPAHPHIYQGIGYPGPMITTFPPTTTYGTWPDTSADDAVGTFRIRKLENGYVIEYRMRPGDAVREYYAEDLKACGERITALAVQKVLEGEPAK